MNGIGTFRLKDEYDFSNKSSLRALCYVHTGPVPNGSDPILERTISVHTVPFRLSTSVHTGPVCYAWLEIEDNMAAKHAHKRQKTDFKYGDNMKLCMGKF